MSKEQGKQSRPLHEGAALTAAEARLAFPTTPEHLAALSAVLAGACSAERRALADLVVREVVVNTIKQDQVKECEVVMGFDGGHCRIEVHYNGTSFGALEKEPLPPGERREESYGLGILYAPSEGWAIVCKRRKTT